MKRNVRSRLALLLALVLCVSNLSSVSGGIGISFATEQSGDETDGTKEEGGSTKATDSDAPDPDEDDGEACICNERCTEDNVNKSCPVCSKDMAGCLGEEPKEDTCTCVEACAEDDVNKACPVCKENYEDCEGIELTGDETEDETEDELEDGSGETEKTDTDKKEDIPPAANGGLTAEGSEEESEIELLADEMTDEEYAESVLKDLADGKDVKLERDVTVDAPVIISGNVNFDLGGFTLEANARTEFEDSKQGTRYANVLVDGDVTITNGTITSTAAYNSYNSLIAVKADGDKLELTDSLTIGECEMLGAIANYGGELITEANIINTAEGTNSIDTYGGKVTINGGTIEAYYGIGVFNRGYDKDSAGADVTINDGEIICTVYIASTNNVRSGDSDLTINGGHFVSSDIGTAIYWPSSGTVTLGKRNADDSELVIEGATPIEICAGRLVVNSGTFTGTGTTTDIDNLPALYVANSGSAGCGDAITVITNRIQAYAQYPLDITINGGVFGSNENFAIRYVDGNASRSDESTYLSQDVNLEINDGYFSGTLGVLETYMDGAELTFSGGYLGEKIDESYIADGYVLNEYYADDSYPYIVMPTDEVFEVWDERYDELADRIDLDANPEAENHIADLAIVSQSEDTGYMDFAPYTWTITEGQDVISIEHDMTTTGPVGLQGMITPLMAGTAVVEVTCEKLPGALFRFTVNVVDTSEGSGSADNGITEVDTSAVSSDSVQTPAVEGTTEEQKAQLEADKEAVINDAKDSVVKAADSSTVEATVRTDTIDNVPAPADEQKLVIGTRQELKGIELEAVTETAEDGSIASVTPVIKKISYEINPTWQLVDADDNKLTETTVFELTRGQMTLRFRIPVPSSVTDRYAYVEHISQAHGTSTGYYSIQTNADGTKYINYATDHFSTFNLTFTNTKPGSGSSYSGGGGGSVSGVIRRGAAVNAMQQGTWEQDSIGWKYKLANGTYPVNTWYQCPWNGQTPWYHFNAQGYLDSGWLVDTDGNTYFLHPHHDGNFGYMYTGWNTIEGKTYFFSTDSSSGLPMGALYKDRTTPDGRTVGADGALIG